MMREIKEAVEKGLKKLMERRTVAEI